MPKTGYRVGATCDVRVMVGNYLKSGHSTGSCDGWLREEGSYPTHSGLNGGFATNVSAKYQRQVLGRHRALTISGDRTRVTAMGVID